MTTLLHPIPAVHSNRAAADALRQDARWWAARTAGRTAPKSQTIDDVDWLCDEIFEWDARSKTPDNPRADVDALVATLLSDLTATFGFHRIHTAAAYAQNRYASGGIDLDALRLPRPGSFRSPLAEQICVEAAWYLHLDSTVASLAAWRLLSTAEVIDMMGSRTVAEWVRDDREDALGDADVELEADALEYPLW